MIIRDAKVLLDQDGAPRADALAHALKEHEQNVRKRLNGLSDYYQGRHSILTRRRALGGIANNRVVVNFARYITTMASGYLIGAPVGYTGDSTDAALDAILRQYDAQSIDSVDAELAKNASEFGRGVEYLYMNEQAQPRTASLDPRTAFVIYSDDVDYAPLVGVHLAAHNWIDGGYSHTAVTACTAEYTYSYRMEGIGGAPIPVGEPVPHSFGGVPINEYWNNDETTGDYEGVTALIDAYNLLQSDRVNDKEQLDDALLVIKGASLGDTGEEAARTLAIMREQRALELPEDGDAEFLSKQLSERDVQVLSDSLRNDIFSMAMVPELTDQNFAGNASGVAMRYKLLGFEQLTKIKERWFREGLKARLRMFGRVMAALGYPALDADGVQMTFTRSLPVNDLEQAQMVSLLEGIIPEEILKNQLGFMR